MWTPLAKSIRCHVWKKRPSTGNATNLTPVSTLLLFWRLDEAGQLRYLDAHGEDVPAVLCHEFEP